MWGAFGALAKGLMEGLVGPLFGWLNKKQDVTLEGFKAATGGDEKTYGAWLNHQATMAQIQLQATQWWGPRVLYMIAGGAAVLHFAAVLLDSMPLTIPLIYHHAVGEWGVAKPPGDYGVYEILIVASVCFVSVAKGPLSAVTAWLNRR